MKNIEEIKNAKASELVAFYNTFNADKPIKKFADRKTAESRCIALLSVAASLNESQPEPQDGVVVVKARKATPKPKKVEETPESHDLPPSDPEEETDEEWQARMAAELDTAHGVTQEDIDEELCRASTPAAGGGTRKAASSDAIAASWKSADVHAARMTRNGVTVTVHGKTSEVLKSVRVAFALFNLPDSKHIRFRLVLKKAGQAIFEHDGVGYLFTLV